MNSNYTIGFLVPQWIEVYDLIKRYNKSFQSVIIPDKLENSPKPIDQIDILIMFSGSLQKNHIDEMKKLKFVQALTAGYDTIDVKYLQKKSIPLADNNGINTNAVAEHTISLILALTRNLFVLQKSCKEGKWQGPPPYIADLHEIKGKKIGIIGLGRIGKLVAQKITSFDVSLQYYDIVRYRAFESKYNISYMSFSELLRTSDVVTTHVPLNQDTHHLMSTNALALMQSSAYFVNTSRGAVVDTQALLHAIRNNMIAGAALDVFEQEPLPEKMIAELDNKNIILTPHRAGSSSENWHGRIQFALENVVRYISGQTPISLVQ
ncbi:MAG: 2-hydroxyacid dehydrogenase [bacterium]|nr:2-hydroxyacid dehydrogenase [bacterium]